MAQPMKRWKRKPETTLRTLYFEMLAVLREDEPGEVRRWKRRFMHGLMIGTK